MMLNEINKPIGAAHHTPGDQIHHDNNPQIKDSNNEHQTALYRTASTDGGCRRGNHPGTELIRSRPTYLL